MIGFFEFLPHELAFLDFRPAELFVCWVNQHDVFVGGGFLDDHGFGTPLEGGVAKFGGLLGGFGGGVGEEGVGDCGEQLLHLLEDLLRLWGGGVGGICTLHLILKQIKDTASIT